jgi:transposase
LLSAPRGFIPLSSHCHGRTAAEVAAWFSAWWWLVQRALDPAAVTLPDVDALAPRMLGIDEHRYRSVQFFRAPATKAWKCYEPWMTTNVDLDSGQERCPQKKTAPLTAPP